MRVWSLAGDDGRLVIMMVNGGLLLTMMVVEDKVNNQMLVLRCEIGNYNNDDV